MQYHKGPYSTHENSHRAVPDHAWPLGTILDHIGPHSTIEDARGPYGIIKDHKEPYGTIRDHTRPYGSITIHRGPHRTIGDHMVWQRMIRIFWETEWLTEAPLILLQNNKLLCLILTLKKIIENRNQNIHLNIQLRRNKKARFWIKDWWLSLLAQWKWNQRIK